MAQKRQGFTQSAAIRQAAGVLPNLLCYILPSFPGRPHRLRRKTRKRKKKDKRKKNA